MVVRPKPSVALDAQQPARRRAARRHGFFHLAHVVEDARRVVQVGFAFGGQADAARGAVHEPHAEPRFQLREPLGGGGRRDVHIACNGGQIAVPREQHEELKLGRKIVFHSHCTRYLL
jgi:hypothetical protein